VIFLSWRIPRCKVHHTRRGANHFRVLGTRVPPARPSSFHPGHDGAETHVRGFVQQFPLLSNLPVTDVMTCGGVTAVSVAIVSDKWLANRTRFAVKEKKREKKSEGEESFTLGLTGSPAPSIIVWCFCRATGDFRRPRDHVSVCRLYWRY